MPKKLSYIGGAVLLLFLAIVFYIRLDQYETDGLYSEALAPESSPDISRKALEKLAHHGQHGKRLLIDVAMGKGAKFSLTEQPQIAAIRTLRLSHDAIVANDIASLLQPHNGLDLRLAVAHSLQDLPCAGPCTESVLHYLERIWHGDLNPEDEVLPQVSSSITLSFEKEHSQLYKDLYSVLERQPRDTIEALQSIYGLGTANPAPFALDLLTHVNLEGACNSLRESELEMNRQPKGFFKAPRAELDRALVAMNCR